MERGKHYLRLVTPDVHMPTIQRREDPRFHGVEIDAFNPLAPSKELPLDCGCQVSCVPLLNLAKPQAPRERRVGCFLVCAYTSSTCSTEPIALGFVLGGGVLTFTSSFMLCESWKGKGGGDERYVAFGAPVTTDWAWLAGSIRPACWDGL